MLASARTFTIDGVSAREVRVEVDVHRGLPAFSIVGLPDAAVRESRERVRAALVNSGFEFPLRRITVNLAPADLPKAGPGLDLATAAALIAASGQLPEGLDSRIALAGELALDGSVRPIAGVLAMAETAREAGSERLVVADANGPEAALVDGLEVLPLERLDQLPALLRGEWEPAAPEPLAVAGPAAGPDIVDLRGQPGLRRALEVTAAGGHSLLMIGPPGAGKSLAARRLSSLLPPLERAEALEVARIASIAGRLNGSPAIRRPFRAPHHSISSAGLVGGGNPPRAGEVTLAHRGVLFLDELGEFGRAVLESLRAPLEDRTVTLTRAGRTVELPSRFMLIAAANPCPCGRGAEDERCRCTPHAVRRYEVKLSGALADRIDIWKGVAQPSAEAMDGGAGERSADVRMRVCAARARQAERLGPCRCNADLSPSELRRLEVEPSARTLLGEQHRALGLSGRGHDRVLRVARTIADLAEAEAIGDDQMAEALGLRRPG
ncbi:MAG: YifB family Mg chelatase-like AAA ATPase [Actinomycetota bacterium]|nr:YifB family Mg chelatase-like AAA ATPase [Actinomycetota bacterium]